MLKYVPNTLTIIRFLLIPAILISIFSENYILAAALFTISGITDIADGFIARKFNLVSNFGKLMDPLADKLTQIATLTSLVLACVLPKFGYWILGIVLLKEFIMICGASFLYGKDVVVYSKWYGKLATVMFFIAIIVSLFIKEFSPEGFLGYIDLPLYLLALIATISALIMYIRDLYNKGFIDKQDLNKEVTIDKKERKKK